VERSDPKDDEQDDRPEGAPFRTLWAPTPFFDEGRAHTGAHDVGLGEAAESGRELTSTAETSTPAEGLGSYESLGEECCRARARCHLHSGHAGIIGLFADSSIRQRSVGATV
jgi:hypothetical protein